MPSKELTWTDLFGSLPSDSSKFESTPFLTNNSDIDQLMKSLGKTLIKDIHFFDNLLKNPKMDPMAKMQCEYTLNEIKKFAYPDIKYLCHLHARLLGATLMAHSPLIVQILESQIIPILEDIINYQSTILKMKACYVTKTAKKRSLLSDYEEQILDHVRNAKYEEAVITATNVCITVAPSEANKLYKQVDKEINKHSSNQDSNFFLAVLEIRLFSKECKKPHNINYNKLRFKYPNCTIPVAHNLDYLYLSDIAKDARTLNEGLFENSLKEKFESLVIPMLDELLDYAKKMTLNSADF